MATTTAATLSPAEVEDQDGFVGWVFTDDTPRSVMCPSGSTAFTSDDFLNCCATSSSTCHIATECVDNTLSYDGRSAITCPSLCATLTVLPTNDATTSLSAQSRLFCARSGAADTAYRRLAESDHAQSTATSTGTSSSEGDEPTRSGDSDNSEDGGGSGGSSSNAWIAGAVLGPLLFLALIAIGVLLYRQRRNRKQNPLDNSVDDLNNPPNMNETPQNFNGAPYQGAYQTPEQAYKMETPASQTWNAPAELDPVQRFEIGTSGEIPSELAGESGFSPVRDR